MYFVAKFKINDACFSKTSINLKVQTIETHKKDERLSEMKANFFCVVRNVLNAHGFLYKLASFT